MSHTCFAMRAIFAQQAGRSAELRAANLVVDRDQSFAHRDVCGGRALGHEVGVRLTLRAGLVAVPEVQAVGPLAGIADQPPPGESQQAEILLGTAAILGGLLLYVVLWALMPDEGDTSKQLSQVEPPWPPLPPPP